MTLKGLMSRIRTPLDRDKQEATQKQLRSLRRSVRILVLPTGYSWKDDFVSIALVTKTGDPNNYREAIEVDNNNKWIIIMEHEIESLNRN